MIDRIVYYNSGDPVYLSDVKPNYNYIGYEDRNGMIYYY